MSIQEPAWLKRTRPCPFFSQGRCLFADSCNFLHNVKVRDVAMQPSLTAVGVKRSALLPEPVFDLPSVVVDAASPRSDSLASPESSESSACGSSRYSGLLSVLSDVIGPPLDSFTTSISISPLAPSLPLPSDSVVTGAEPIGLVADTNAGTVIALVDPSASQTETSLPEEDDAPAAEPVVSILDDAEAADRNTTFCLVEDTKIHESGVEGSSDDGTMDDHREQDSTAMASNRQSTLSSFTGASLLASPPNSVFEEPSASSSSEDGAAELLSPVELSAKLRPFPIPSFASKLKRGDSIDLGYVDGDGWASPLPFPRSPPRSFRSSVTFLSHSRRTSHSSLSLKDRRVSYDVRAVRPSLYNPVDVIKEVDSGGTSEHDSENNRDTPYTIYDAYHSSPTGERGENDAYDALEVNTTAVVDKIKEDDKQQVLTIRRSPHQSSNEHLHPIEEYVPDLCNRTSFVSEDNISFRTALSAQPSYDNLSDISIVSPVKQDSLLSFVSGRSTPNTSILSYYSDANDSLEQPTVGTRIREICLVTTTDLVNQNVKTEVSEVGTSEGSFFSKEVTLDSDIPFVSAVKFAAPRRPLSNAFHCDDSRNLSSTTDGFAHVPSGVDSVCVPADVSDPQVSSQEVVSALPECSPSILPYIRDTSDSSSSSRGSCGLPLCEDILGYALADTDDQECTAENVVSLQERSPETLRLDELPSKPSSSVDCSSDPSPAKDILGSAAHCEASSAASEARKFAPQEDLSDHPLIDSSNDTFAFPPQSPEIGASLGSDKIADSFDSESGGLTQRLSFPLPPPFLPAELVKRLSISNADDISIPHEGTVGNLTKDAQNACRVSQYEIQHSGSDLTEKARPNQLPVVESLNFDTDTALRRNRAASDLTMKGKSPLLTIPEGVPHILGSPLTPPPQESESHSQPLDRAPHTLQGQIFSNTKPSTPGTDSPQSENVFRPLLTRRRSLLRSSFAELVPTAIHTANERSFPTHLSRRLQAKEIGNTVVPLGFRRHKPQLLRSASQPLQSVLPASELREALRIRTDVARDLPPECSSLSPSHVSFGMRSPLPVQSMSAPPTGGLRQLHLTSIANKRSSTLSTQSSSITSSIVSNHILNTSSLQSPSVSSATSFSHSSSLHSSSHEQIPEHVNHTLKRCSSDSLIPRVTNDAHFPSQLRATCDPRSFYAPARQRISWCLSHYRADSRNYTSADGSGRLSGRTLGLSYAVDEEQEIDDGPTASHSTVSNHTDGWMCPTSIHTSPAHAIATPKPTLLFAIASDDVNQVRRVLENGEAGPNDSVGPQSALAFTLTNHKLAHKQEIVKALLAYGANPSVLHNPTLNPAPRIQGCNESSGPPPETTLEGMDPATRYFVARADAAHTRQTSQLIYRSFFRPLTRVRYDVIGQDWALEQLFRVLSMHSQKLAVSPIVVLLCGPSGHGKSLLARKFGSLLDVPTHTVNMTTLRSTHDIWQSYSMSPYEEPSSHTLAEFLTENEGKRCVVVLDEIEKVEDQKALWSLLMPWELGRCSLEAGKRHIDARNVIWLGTSNIGHELVFEHHEKRAEPDKQMSREEYLELTGLLRPRVSHCLGASLVSRVTTVLPFVPFTLDEKKAIAAEAIYALAGDASKTLSPQDVESLVMKALPSYQPSEGARSLHRAISNILIDRF